MSNTKKAFIFKLITLLANFLLITTPAYAEDLSYLYKLSIDNDPSIRSAYYTEQASLETIPQAVANFLPNLSSAITSSGHSSTNPNLKNYNSHSYSIILSQPILNLTSISKYSQAKDQVTAAISEYAAQKQELIIRLTTQYLNILSAKNNLEFALAEQKSFAKILEQTKQKFDVGLIAATDVHESQARHDIAAAEVISAQNNIATEYEKITEIVGINIDHIIPFKEQIELEYPNPNIIENWVEYALQNNLKIKIAQANLNLAKKQISQEKSGHMPTINLNGKVTRSNPIPGSDPNISITNKEIGLTLNIPIFSGGAINSKTRTAMYKYQAYAQILDKNIKEVTSNTKQAFRSIITQINKIHALKQAVKSNLSALESTTKAFEIGSRTISDVLDAQRDLLNAQRNYANSKHIYILEGLKLKQYAGSLNDNDLEKINSFLIK